MEKRFNIFGYGLASLPENWVQMMNQTVLVDRIYYIVREGAGYIIDNQKHYFMKNHIYVINHSLNITYFWEDKDFYHAYIDYSAAFSAEYDNVIEICPQEDSLLKTDVNAFLYFLRDKNIRNIHYKPKYENFYQNLDRILLILEAFLYDVGEIYPKRELKNAMIAQSIRYIQKHYADNISVQFLAEKTHLSKNHFTRLFFKETGMTPYQYIKSYRLDIAASMLKTGISISEIAENCGFLSSSAFSSSFKKQYGCAPREFVEI